LVWAAELNARYIFEKAFLGPRGEGYPKERREPQVQNAGILNQVKTATMKRQLFGWVKSDLIKSWFASGRQGSPIPTNAFL